MIPKALTWNDKFALIEIFHPTDNKILIVFNMTTTELNVARNLKLMGLITPSKNIDYESYASAFTQSDNDVPIMNISIEPTGNTTPIITTRATSPETATKKTKKRGRKGSNISLAFQNIPKEPISVIDFSVDNSVSIAVLRQSKRFDTHKELGVVRVKKNKETGLLMIWRSDDKQTT